MRPLPDLRPLLAAALLVSTLAACSGTDDPEPEAGGSSTPTASTSADGGTAAAPGGTSPDGTSSDGAPADGSSSDGGTTDGSGDPSGSAGSGDAGSGTAGSGGQSGDQSGGGQDGGGQDGGQSGGGQSGGGAAADPNSPFVVAATAVAARSRDQVTQLHAMGVATTGQGGLPADQLPALGTNIAGELGRQIEDATMLPPPAGSPAARLVTALHEYADLAGRLAAWDPAGPALPSRWFDRLQANDRAWKTSLRDLGRLSEQDLLAAVPPLAMPS
jgi:hypothetical protein